MGFEAADPARHDRPAGWQARGALDGVSLDGSVRHSGTRALRLHAQDGESAAVAEKVAVEKLGGGRVTLRGFLRRDNGKLDGPTLWMRAESANGDPPRSREPGSRRCATENGSRRCARPTPPAR